jgi:hypothetical protein
MSYSKKSLILNPFQRIAGWEALLVGVAAMALTAVIGKLNNVIFDGVIDVHFMAVFGYSAAFAMQAVNLFALFLTMWLAGICFSKSKLRAIDIAGTMALAHAPMLLLAIVFFLPIAPESLYDIPRLIISGIITILFSIWTIVLMYNAYSVSCHLKGVRAVVSFIGALIVAEILSKVVLYFLAGSLFANVPITDTFKSVFTKNTEVAADLSLSNRQKAENVVNAFERGDFNAITIYFDSAMKEALPPIGLKNLWLSLYMQYGKFEKADTDNIIEKSKEDYDEVIVPLYFQKEQIKFRLVFTKEGVITGLWVH